MQYSDMAGDAVPLCINLQTAPGTARELPQGSGERERGTGQAEPYVFQAKSPLSQQDNQQDSRQHWQEGGGGRGGMAGSAAEESCSEGSTGGGDSGQHRQLRGPAEDHTHFRGPASFTSAHGNLRTSHHWQCE